MSRNSLLVIAAMICLVGGCGSSDTAEDFADREHAAALEAASRIPIQSESITGDMELEDDSPLKDLAAFAEDFAKRFNQDKQQAFTDLVSWDGISQEDRGKNMKLFLRTDEFIGGLDGRVRGKPGYQTIEEYGSYVTYVQMPDSELVPPPTHLIMVNLVNDNEDITQVWYPVGKTDGEFHICAATSKP